MKLSAPSAVGGRRWREGLYKYLYKYLRKGVNKGGGWAIKRRRCRREVAVRYSWAGGFLYRGWRSRHEHWGVLRSTQTCPLPSPAVPRPHPPYRPAVVSASGTLRPSSICCRFLQREWALRGGAGGCERSGGAGRGLTCISVPTVRPWRPRPAAGRPRSPHSVPSWSALTTNSPSALLLLVPRERGSGAASPEGDNLPQGTRRLRSPRLRCCTRQA